MNIEEFREYCLSPGNVIRQLSRQRYFFYNDILCTFVFCNLVQDRDGYIDQLKVIKLNIQDL